MKNGTQARVRFGEFEVDLSTRELMRAGEPIRLAGQPFEILAVLVTRPGELVSREELRARLWPQETFVDFDHGLNAAINKLRDALNDSADNPRFIETLPRRGYRFIASVESTGTAEPPLLPPTEPAKTHIPHLLHSAPMYAAVAVGAIVLALAVYFGTRTFRTRTEARDLSTVIKPLTNLSDATAFPAFSPDGTRVAFIRRSLAVNESGLYITNVGSGEITDLVRDENICCPVWSPDGSSIAFTRGSDDSRTGAIFVVPSTQSRPTVQRKLDTGDVQVTDGEIDWSPDGSSIAFSSDSGIFLLALQNSQVRRLTQAPPLSKDQAPSFSWHGDRLLFVRSRGAGFSDEIYSVAVSGGEPTQVTSENARVVGTPRWSADDRSVIYTVWRAGQRSLWRVPLDRRSPPVQINDSGSRPTVARTGNRLAYERTARGLNIWQLNLTGNEGNPTVLVSSTSQTDQGPGPEYSPDGTKLAYMSDRSGTMEIWVSDADGSNAHQATAVGNAGTPRWSPDGRAIVYDVTVGSGSAIYVTSLDTGASRALVDDGHPNVCPSWSRDGKWIYFASRRPPGDMQLWKIPANGGTAVQMTKHGGHASRESRDGKTLYYAKTYYANPEIWQVPVNGGEEKLVSSSIRPATWASWAVVDDGILFAGPSQNGPAVQIFDTATHRVKKLGSLQIPPFWLTATHDAKKVAFDKPGWEQPQVMIVENFH